AGSLASCLASDSFFKLLIERLKTFNAFGKKFLIIQAALGPSAQDGIDTDAFGTLKLAVFQVGIMDHLGDLRGCPVSDAKTLQKRFKGAIVTMMGKFDVNHVKRK